MAKRATLIKREAGMVLESRMERDFTQPPQMAEAVHHPKRPP
jgi:hypothetical protein